MADFYKAIDAVLLNEGGYVANPADPGGETNFGISKRMYPTMDIKNLTREQAVTVYKRDYWEFDALVDQPVANKLMDMKVNMGPTWAFRLLQRGLVNRWHYNLSITGTLDAATLVATNTVHEDDLLNELRAQSVLHYFGIANSNPSQKQFLMGWIRRAVQ